MSAKKRRQSVLKKIIFWILWAGLFVSFGFLVNFLFFSKGALFISPLGEEKVSKEIIGRLLKDKNILFSKITASELSYVVEIPDSGRVTFSSQKNIDNQIASLQRILRALTIEGKLFKSIDFRFNEPIVSF